MAIKVRQIGVEDAAYEQVSQLRYDVYATEEGLALSDMDHERRTIQDAYDACSSIFAAFEGPRVIGTLRWTPMAAFQAQPAVSASFDARRLGAIEDQILVGRLVVALDRRGGAACQRLMTVASRAARDAGFTQAFLESSPRNVPLYEAIGCRLCHTVYDDPNFGLCVPMLLVLDRPAAPLRRGKRATEAKALGAVSSCRLMDPLHHAALISEIQATEASPWKRLDVDTLTALLRSATVFDVPAGCTVLHRGSLAPEMFVVLSGQVCVRQAPRHAAHRPDRPDQPDRVLGPGAWFGGQNLLTGAHVPAARDHVTDRPSRILAFGASVFIQDVDFFSGIHGCDIGHRENGQSVQDAPRPSSA